MTYQTLYHKLHPTVIYNRMEVSQWMPSYTGFSLLPFIPILGKQRAWPLFLRLVGLCPMMGWTNTLGKASETKIEKEIVKETVLVYRRVPEGNYRTAYNITAPNNFMHSLIERVFGDAGRIGVIVELRECGPANRSSLSPGIKIQIDISGTKQRVKIYEENIQHWVNFMNKNKSDNSSYRKLPRLGKPWFGINIPKSLYSIKLFRHLVDNWRPYSLLIVGCYFFLWRHK